MSKIWFKEMEKFDSKKVECFDPKSLHKIKRISCHAKIKGKKSNWIIVLIKKNFCKLLVIKKSLRPIYIIDVIGWSGNFSKNSSLASKLESPLYNIKQKF